MATPTRSLQPPELLLPIYNDSDLSLKKLASVMGISRSELAQIANKVVRTIERDRASTGVLNQLQPVIYTLKMLWSLTDGDRSEIQRWLREPLIEWRGLSPLNCLIEGKFDAVVALVERIYYGDSAGY